MDDFWGPPPPLTLMDLFRAGATPEIITHQVQLPRPLYEATGYTHVALAFAYQREDGSWKLYPKPSRDIPAPKAEQLTRDAHRRTALIEVDGAASRPAPPAGEDAAPPVLGPARATPDRIVHQAELPGEFTLATGYTHVTLGFAFQWPSGPWVLEAWPTREPSTQKSEGETRDADRRFSLLEID